MSWWIWILICIVCSMFSFALGGSFSMGKVADEILANNRRENEKEN